MKGEKLPAKVKSDRREVVAWGGAWIVTIQKILGVFVSKGKDPMTMKKFKMQNRADNWLRKLDYFIWK